MAEVQLCVDAPESSPEDAKKIQLRHFLYELERGLFGPTFELIMQYEDFTRSDIAVKLQSKGSIKAREGDGESKRMKQAGRVILVLLRDVRKGTRW